MTIGKALKAQREKVGLSQSALAIKAGVPQSLISDLETGRRLSTKYLPEIANVLSCDIRDIDPRYAVPSAGSEVAAVHIADEPEGSDDGRLPVFSSAEGGHGALVVTTDPIDFVVRPRGLRHVRAAFAVIVFGESMVPVYEPGDMLLINPALQPVRGKNGIFVKGEPMGEFIAMVKRLERSTSTEWHVKQWNPPEGEKQEFTLPKVEWTKSFRIVGKLDNY